MCVCLSWCFLFAGRLEVKLIKSLLKVYQKPISKICQRGEDREEREKTETERERGIGALGRGRRLARLAKGAASPQDRDASEHLIKTAGENMNLPTAALANASC